MRGLGRLRDAAVRFESRGYPGQEGPRGIVFDVPTDLGSGAPDWVEADWLLSGARAIRAVGCVVVDGPFGTVLRTGTGFLVGEGLLLTNHHVLPDAGDAAAARLELDFRVGSPGTVPVALDPGACFVAHRQLDYALVGVDAPDSRPCLAPGDAGAVRGGTPLVVVQHPGGGPQRVTFRNAVAFGPVTDVVHYTTDTDEGSSGAPVLDDAWRVIGLHRAGVPRRDGEGRILDLEDNPWDPATGRDRIRFIANEGVAFSAIRADLERRLPRLPRRTRARVGALLVGVALCLLALTGSARAASTDAQEKVAFAESANQEIREAEAQIAKLVEEARREGDTESVSCRESRLTSVRALLQVSERAEVSMRDALSASEEERAELEFRRIHVATSKTRMLRVEAAHCRADEGNNATLVNWENWETKSVFNGSTKATWPSQGVQPVELPDSCVLCEGDAFVPSDPIEVSRALLQRAMSVVLVDLDVDGQWVQSTWYGCPLQACVQVGVARRSGRVQRMEFALVAASYRSVGVLTQVSDRREGLATFRSWGLQSLLAPAAPASDGGKVATRIARALVALGTPR